MVIFTGTLLVLMATAAPMDAVAAASEEVPILSVWMVQATAEEKTEKEFDAELVPIRKTLARLPFARFKCLTAWREAVHFDQERQIPVSGRYSFFVKPVRKEHDRRLRLNLRVEMPAKELRGKPVEALKAEILLEPGKPFKVQGFHLEQGELIMVMQVAYGPPPKASGPSHRR